MDTVGERMDAGEKHSRQLTEWLCKKGEFVKRRDRGGRRWRKV